jgi:hypothetical protein
VNHTSVGVISYLACSLPTECSGGMARVEESD